MPHRSVRSSLAVVATAVVFCSLSGNAARAEVESPKATAASAAWAVHTAAVKWRPAPFARRWMGHANNRDWKWIRSHSDLGSANDYKFVINQVKFHLRELGPLRMGKCYESGYHPDDANKRDCYTKGAGVVEVTRKRSGKVTATDFRIED